MAAICTTARLHGDLAGHPAITLGLSTPEIPAFTIKVRVRSDAAVSTAGGSLTIINTATVRSTDTSIPI
jgi:hypothetical protein